MKVGLALFPATTGGAEALRAGRALGWEVVVLGPERAVPRELDLVLLPGGDPDPLARSAQAASPLGHSLPGFAADGGRLLGLGAGFALLCELGLLPGSLNPNPSGRLHHGPLPCRLEQALGPWRAGTVLSLPIATRAGAYALDPEALVDLELEGRILLRLCGPEGEIGETWNPLGARGGVAGLRDATGRVIGLLPQLERQDVTEAAGPLLSALIC